MENLTGNWRLRPQGSAHVTMGAQVDRPQDPSMDWMTEHLALLQDTGVSESHPPIRRGSVHSRVTPQPALTYDESFTPHTPLDSLRSPFPPTLQQMDGANDLNDISWLDHRPDNSAQKFMLEVASLKQELGTLRADVKGLKSQCAEEASNVPMMVNYVKQLSNWFIKSKSGLDHGMSELTVAMERMGEIARLLKGHEETGVEDDAHVGQENHVQEGI